MLLHGGGTRWCAYEPASSSDCWKLVLSCVASVSWLLTFQSDNNSDSMSSLASKEC